MNNNYRGIEVYLDRPLYAEEVNVLGDIANDFPKKDFFFEYESSKITVYLNQIDLLGFKRYIEDTTKKYSLGQKYLKKADNIFHRILKKIEKIGSYGIKGKKRLFVGYNQERKVRARKKKAEKRGFHYYAQGNMFSTKNNELPNEFLNEIICGDSKVILKRIPDNCIDLILTSPPYNFGLDYNATEDWHKWRLYFNKLFQIFDQCIRILKYGGRIIVDIQPLFSEYIPSHHVISDFFRKNKMIWKGEILWDKHNYNCKYTSWSSWKSPSSPYLKYTWKFLEIYAKGSLKKAGKREDSDITAEEFKKWVFAKWDVAPERNMQKWEHPAMFPEELVRRAIKLFSFKNDVVLDPFNGVGTTTVVAKRLGRRYVGIDISKEYSDIAKKRLDDETM
ncbi:MAG: DNA-methyltransferase [Candidatus Ranarchaeia archaeon]